MQKSTATILYVIAAVVVLFAGTCTFRFYSLRSDKREAVATLEAYHKQHARYPKAISEVSCSCTDRFDYQVDSSFQSYTLSYTHGVMNSSTTFYHSTSKWWTTQFNF